MGAAAALALLTGVWLAFLVVPPWLCCFFVCRQAACWRPEDKIKGYVTITAPWKRRMLIPAYSGYHPRLRTNIPLLYTRFVLNPYPDRLSRLGLVDWWVSGAISAAWTVCVTLYFWAGIFHNPLLPALMAVMMVHALVMAVLINWNKSGAPAGGEGLTRAQLRERKRAGKL